MDSALVHGWVPDLGRYRYYLRESVTVRQATPPWVYLQYLTASSKAHMSLLNSIRGIVALKVSSGISSQAVTSVSCGMLSLLLKRCLLPLCERDVTLPGASHLSREGLALLYLGQTVPEEVHLLHEGWVKSQTKQRRRHSQQWRFGASILCAFTTQFDRELENCS